LPSHTQGGSRMRESRTYGSVRGARDETHVCCDCSQPLVAQLRHAGRAHQCPQFGVQRTYHRLVGSRGMTSKRSCRGSLDSEHFRTCPRTRRRRGGRLRMRRFAEREAGHATASVHHAAQRRGRPPATYKIKTVQRAPDSAPCSRGSILPVPRVVLPAFIACLI